jgi:transcriptional regulator with XRE-family HTH domain
MPRPNPARAAPDEENLARRIEHERTTKGWSYESLAKRMEEAGVKIHPSAIYKIEKGEPRRRVTVNEFRAFAQVFDIPMDQMLVPEGVWSTGLALELFTAYLNAVEMLRLMWERQDTAEYELRKALTVMPRSALKAIGEALRDQFPDLPDFYFELATTPLPAGAAAWAGRTLNEVASARIHPSRSPRYRDGLQWEKGSK